MTRTDEIRAAIQRRYPCQEMPYGAAVAMAAEFGVTRQLISLVMKNLHTIPVRSVRICGICSQPVRNSNKKGIHIGCRSVELPCAECGAPVRRKTALLANRYGSGRYTGRVFCNYTCVGKYAGQHYGTGNPDHPVHQKKGAAQTTPATH